jgi:hypothetical protein
VLAQCAQTLKEARVQRVTLFMGGAGQARKSAQHQTANHVLFLLEHVGGWLAKEPCGPASHQGLRCASPARVARLPRYGISRRW